MAKAIQQLSIVVASPSDVEEERNSVEAVAAEISHDYDFFGVDLKVVQWETDSYPGFHSGGPQGLIAPLLRIEDADIVVGIFWKRFGKPTKSGETGTEHEINTAIQAWRKNESPHIMLYFSNQPYTLHSKEEAEQLVSVLDFKKKLEAEGEGLFWNYNDSSSFRANLSKHLKAYLKKKYGAPKPSSSAPVFSRHEWHPPSDIENRGELAPCRFSINPNYKTDGEGRWNRWGDLLVNLENAQNSDNVYLVPSRKAPERFREPDMLKKPGPLAAKRKFGEAFGKKFTGKRLEGLWFLKRIRREGKDRVHVYCTQYDDFLNEAASAAAEEPKIVPA